MTHLDLFAGIGGFALAARNVGLTFDRHYYSEVDPKASRVYAKNFPSAIALGDITKIDGKQLKNEIGESEEIVICGGSPCQDASTGKRNAQGINGPKSSLWQHYRRLIDELEPKLIVWENVAAVANRGLERVLFPLAASGYRVEWAVLRGATYGALHRRDRMFVVAHSRGERLDAATQRLPRLRNLAKHGQPDGAAARDSARAEWERAKAERAFLGQPLATRVADGLPGQLDRIKQLGNSVHVPTVEAVFRACIDAGLLKGPGEKSANGEA